MSWAVPSLQRLVKQLEGGTPNPTFAVPVIAKASACGRFT